MPRTERWYPAIREIADNVNLLDLPQDIQDSVHSGDLDYRKARKLTILTRVPADDQGRRLKDGTYSEPAQRTDRWYLKPSR